MIVVRNHDDFVQKAKLKLGDAYTVLGKYEKSGVRILMRHNICNYEWNVFPNNLFGGRSKCPKCSDKLPLTTELFKEKVAAIDKSYIVLGEYINAVTKVKIKHTTCDYEWMVRPNHITSTGARCPRCQNKESYNNDDFKKLVSNTTNMEYEFNGNYVNNRIKAEFLHVKCGTSFMESPASFLYSEQRCPSCTVSSMSNGEKKIFDLLDRLRVEFNPQYTFKDCKSINRLRFDFALMKEQEVLGLIEFDGGQHFKPVKWFGGEKGFQKQKQRDEIKNKYCNENNIPLLRIPFWEYDNIDALTTEFIKTVA